MFARARILLVAVALLSCSSAAFAQPSKPPAGSSDGGTVAATDAEEHVLADADGALAETPSWQPTARAWRLAVGVGATGARDTGARFYSDTGYLPAFTLAVGYQLARPFSVDAEYEVMSASNYDGGSLRGHVIGVRGSAVLLDRVPVLDPYVTARLGLAFAQQRVDLGIDALVDRASGVDAMVGGGGQLTFGESRRYIGFVEGGYRFRSAFAFDSAETDDFGGAVDLGDVSLRGPFLRVGFRMEFDRP